MSKLKTTVPTEGMPGMFPWDLYAGGNTGTNLVANTKVKTGDRKIICYSHDANAQDTFNKYMQIATETSVKDLKKDMLVSITDLAPTKNGMLMASISGGMASITIDLNKEEKFLNILSAGDEKISKDNFLKFIKDPDFKKSLLDMGLVAKVGTDIEKASIWNGYVENIINEMKSQVTLNTKAYLGQILDCNNGGFTVEVAGVIKAFMPGSMAAANKVIDYQGLVGKSIEVMVESYDPKNGFIVSHKKYLRTILPIHIANLAKDFEAEPNAIYEGSVTGTTPFGIFIELTPILTGMLHKTLISDDLREKLRNNQIEPGTKIDVYIHKIENNRIILSDVPMAERDAVIAKREAEEESEAPLRKAPKLSAKQVSTTIQ